MTFGWLQSKLSKYTSVIAKINLANKYGKLNYSTYAYPSPKLSEEEEELIYFVIGQKCKTIAAIEQMFGTQIGKQGNLVGLTKEFLNEPYVAEIRTFIKQAYETRAIYSIGDRRAALPNEVIQLVFDQIKYVEQLGKIDTENYELEVVDRFEKCCVESKDSFKINMKEQMDNLLSYYLDDRSHGYNIYYDPKTMQPFFKENRDGYHVIKEQTADETLILKEGTVYYKWSRTIKPKLDETSLIGKTLVINANTFPTNFKIVGETYIREQKTQKDSRYQFVINRAAISNQTNIELQADGDPTTFSMTIDVLSPPNEIMMELRQFDVDEDTTCGGTRIIPQSSKYSYTPTLLETKNVQIENDEIF